MLPVLQPRSARTCARLVFASCLLSGLALATPTRAEIAPGYQAIGPIDVQTRYQRPSVAVYVDLEAGQSFQVQVTHEDGDPPDYLPYDPKLPRALVKVLDPAELLVHHRLIDTAVSHDTYPDLAPDDLASGLLANTELQAQSAGTHMIRLSAGYEHSKLHLGLPEGSDYALSYGNGIWREWRDSTGPLWIWLPGHATEDTTVELRHDSGTVTIYGPGDAWSHTLAAGNWSRTVPAGGAGEMWRLDDMSPDWRLRAAGDVAVIAATSEALAQALGASLVTVESGPMAGHRFPHLFQKRIAEELVPALVELIGDGSELRAMTDAVRADEACTQPGEEELTRQGAALIRAYVPSVTWALDNWRFGAEATEHPFADVDHHFAITPVMARLYAYPHPCNPWGPSAPDAADGRPELIARAALAALTHLLTITEDDRLSTGHDTWSNYAGGSSAFQTFDRAWSFAMLVPQLHQALPSPLADQLLETFVDGMRRLTVDRRYTDPFVSAANQSSNFLPAFGALALSRSEPRLEAIARAYAERFSASADAAGWFHESLGPDATYNGITHAMLAHYYMMTAWMPGCSDANVRAALIKSYRFFNATVAPEPAGNMLGGFNFSHRTAWGFYAEQYGGARNRTRDIPEVALWSDPTPPNLQELQDDLTYVLGQFDNLVNGVPNSQSTLLARFVSFVASDLYHFPADHAELRFPALHGDTDQLIDDELYALRKPGMYTVLYTGHPIHNAFYTDKSVPYIVRATPPTDGCPPLHNASYEDNGVPLPGWYSQLCPDPYPGYATKHPFVGGGLTMVWTPEFGAGLMAANWSPIVHHGVVGMLTNPTTSALERTWERYAATVFHSADSSGAELSGSIPMYYEATDEIDYARSYSFADDAVTVEVTLTNQTGATQTFDALWENLPFPVCSSDCDNNRKNRPVFFAEADGTPLADGTHLLGVVHITDDQGHGLALELDGGPRQITVNSVGMIHEVYSIQLQIGRLQVPFDTASLADGASTQLRYHLRSLDPLAAVPPVTPVTDTPEILCGEPYPSDGGGGAGGAGGSGGAGGGGGGAAPGAGSEDDSGCGCRAAPAPPAALWLLAVLAGLGAASLRRWW